MDYESKKLLNRLVDEVEKLNSPDWWVIGITVVNALIMAWLGWKQYKLQKQQTKQQGYELYRKLYVVIDDINILSNRLLNRIYEYLTIPLYCDTENNCLKYLLERINLLDKQFAESLVDFKIWTSFNDRELENYRHLIYTMRLLVQFIQNMEEDKVIAYIDDYNNRAVMNAARNDYALLIDEIVRRVTDDSYRKSLERNLNRYVRTKDDVLKLNCLDRIEKFCKFV